MRFIDLGEDLPGVLEQDVACCRRACAGASSIDQLHTELAFERADLLAKLATKLKVMGVELASMGDVRSTQPDDEVVVYREPSRGVYKKLVVRGNTLVGAILLGEADTNGVLTQMFMLGTPVPQRRADLLFGTSSGAPILSVLDLPDHAQICNCNGGSKGQIKEAIQLAKCRSVSKVGACTKAGLGCGSYKPLIQQFLEIYAGDVEEDDPSEHYYVPGVPLAKSELIAATEVAKALAAQGLEGPQHN